TLFRSTIWHMVNLKPSVGRRRPWIFSMSFASSNSFMPIGWVRMRSISISLELASAIILPSIFSGDVLGLRGPAHWRFGVPELVGCLPAFGHRRIDEARRHAVHADVGPERQR